MLLEVFPNPNDTMTLTHTGDAERALVAYSAGEEFLVNLIAQLGNTLHNLVIPCLHITVTEGNK